MRLFLAGEGPNELGGWGRAHEYREDAPVRGVLEALLGLVVPEGWEIIGGVKWAGITKFRAGRHADPEGRNVLGAAQRAREHRCDALVFVRDSDGDAARVASIERALLDDRIRCKVVGGAAVQNIEAWLVAIGGTKNSEALGRRALRGILADWEIADKNTADYTAHLARHGLARIPPDALSLRLWLDRARALLAP